VEQKVEMGDDVRQGVFGRQELPELVKGVRSSGLKVTEGVLE
jgi:hypothetical protein